MPTYLARTGLAVFAMLFGITLLTEHAAAGRALVAGPTPFDLPQLSEIARTRIDVAVVPAAVAGFDSAAPIPAPPVAAAVVAVPAPNDAVVLASWYGPGFY